MPSFSGASFHSLNETDGDEAQQCCAVMGTRKTSTRNEVQDLNRCHRSPQDGSDDTSGKAQPSVAAGRIEECLQDARSCGSINADNGHRATDGNWPP
jgi:hypothetical protein